MKLEVVPSTLEYRSRNQNSIFEQEKQSEKNRIKFSSNKYLIRRESSNALTKDEENVSRAPEKDLNFRKNHKFTVGQQWQTTEIKANIKHLLHVAKGNGNTYLT